MNIVKYSKLLPLFAFSAMQASAQQRPNVIVILADDLGYGDLSCYDGTAPIPAVYRLAQSGVRFTDAHSNAEIFCEIGLIDTTCPPSAVWSSLNAAKGKKTVKCVPYRTHAWPEGYWRPLWEQDYLNPRKEFIANYLSGK